MYHLPKFLLRSYKFKNRIIYYWNFKNIDWYCAFVSYWTWGAISKKHFYNHNNFFANSVGIGYIVAYRNFLQKKRIFGIMALHKNDFSFGKSEMIITCLLYLLEYNITHFLEKIIKTPPNCYIWSKCFQNWFMISVHKVINQKMDNLLKIVEQNDKISIEAHPCNQF